MKTQKQLILEALQEGYILSKLQILQKFGCINGGGRIHELRNEGYNIKMKKIQHKAKKNCRFAVYYLEK